jgi:hypothetical protein
MGGRGSGRYSYGGATASDYQRLDVRFLQKNGYLKSSLSAYLDWRRDGETYATVKIEASRASVTLDYKRRDRDAELVPVRYPVYLDWTRCNYGGDRAWFRCPASGCGKRVAILYYGGIFACRRCYRITYPSQREDYWGRALVRADKIRDRLGWESGVLNGYGPKPKWMRWQTFERLVDEHDREEDLSWVGAFRRFGLAELLEFL